MKHANTRTVKRGDPDYKKHSRIGRGRYVIGDIELTEYDLECMTCKTYVSYDEQCPIMMAQYLYRFAATGELSLRFEIFF